MGAVRYVEDGPRVLSVYEGFFAGGARIQHTAVVRSLEATTGQQHRVLSLTNRSERESSSQPAHLDASYRRLVRAGIPVTLLDRSSSDELRPPHHRALADAVAQADLVMSLKEQPLTALSGTELGGRPVLVSLHRSDPEHQGAGLDVLVDLVDRGIVRAAVCCAHATQSAYHAATGIPLDRLPVIANGVDLHRFRPDEQARDGVRRRLGAADGDPVVVLSARFDPMKDVALFAAATARFVREHPRAHVVMCGAGMAPDNPALRSLLSDALGGWDAAGERLHLLGICGDMPPLYAAADLVVLTSAYGEAAPLTLLEAMACGAVPVTTDVGDAARIVGDPRLVVDRDPSAVAAGWSAAFAERDEHRTRIATRRVSLSDQRSFDAYAALITAHTTAGALSLAS